jgi:hypothetical protein
VALTLVTPTAAVNVLPSGINVVRCHDYVGGARGTLTTTADAASVSGTVVAETQTVAVQTAFASQGTLYGGVANTVVVPKADLTLDGDALLYRVFIGMKISGDVPANAQALATWGTFPRGGATTGFGWGTNLGFGDGPLAVARGKFSEYLIYDCGQYTPSTETELRIRGWGVTGGTIEMRFDIMYLLPVIVGVEMDGQDTVQNSGNAFLPFSPAPDGTLFEDEDNSTANWLGKFSVQKWQFPWMDVGAMDVQDTQTEPTVQNVNGSSEWTEDANPRSYLAMIVGVTGPPDAEAILHEQFVHADTPISNVSYIGADNYMVHISDGAIDNSYNYPPAGLDKGWWIVSNVATCYFGANDSGDGFDNAYAAISFGAEDNSAAAAGDPRLYVPVLDLRGGVFSGRFNIDTLQDAYVAVGVQESPEGSLNNMATLAVANLDSGGNIELRLSQVGYNTAVSGGEDVFSTPATVITGYSTGDWVWVKAEKRGYLWRAKAWVDGDTEPDWQVDGYEPLYATGTAPDVNVPYEYDVNWVGNANHDTVFHDPRGGNAPNITTPALYAAVGTGLPHMIVQCTDFVAEWDPDSTTAGDMTVLTKKYDGSTVIDPQVVVPYGSHRFVTGPLKTRRFNTDTDGWSAWAWREPGMAEMAFASVGYIWELRIHTAPLYGYIKHP